MDDELEMPLVSQLHHFLITDPPFGWVRYSRRGDRVRHVIRGESVWVLTEKSGEGDRSEITSATCLLWECCVNPSSWAQAID